MNREQQHELEAEEAQGAELFEHEPGPHEARIEREAAEGIEVFADPDADLMPDRDREGAEGHTWIPE